MRIDFSPPDIQEADIQAVVEVLRSGWITSGPVSRAFEAELASMCGTNRVVSLNSCTAALEIALRLIGVGPGDEVIAPAYTYTATGAVVQHVGAELVLVDSAPDSYVPDIERIRKVVTNRTKAIIVVDVAGVPFPAEELRTSLAGSQEPRPMGAFRTMDRPVIIVDSAHGLGATRRGIRAGAIGDLTAFSFHAVKNLTTAEGGALTWRPDLGVDDENVASHARRLSLHGQTKDALAKSKAGAWEYDILECGYKSNMPDVLAALGLSQLHRYESAISRRLDILARYKNEIDGRVSLVEHAGPEFRSSGHLALVDLGELAPLRDQFIEGMAKRGVSTNVHYKPLPLLTAYRDLGFNADDFPNALTAYEREVTLPLHTCLTDEDVDYVIASVNETIAGL